MMEPSGELDAQGTGAAVVPAISKLRRFLRDEREVLIAFVTTRLLVCAIGWFAYEAVPHSTEHGISGGAPWQFLFRWDAVHYHHIATVGYDTDDPASPTVPFFPLYPLLLRGLAMISGVDPAILGFLLSNLLLLVGAIWLRRLLRLDFAPASRVPERSVWLLLVNPMTFFFSAIYTESLFLLLIVAAFFSARKAKWFTCAVIGALATATRPNAGLLLVPLISEAVAARSQPDVPNKTGGSPLWLVIVPIGLLAYAAYLRIHFGDALAFWHSQALMNREALYPWEAFIATLDYPPPDAALFFVTAFGAIGLCVLMFVKRIRLSYALFASAMTLLCLSSTWYALPRYFSVVFPFYVVVAVLTEKSEAAFVAVVVGSTMLMAICLSLFVTGYPII